MSMIDKLRTMPLGAEPKKIATLSGLMLVLAYFTYTNVIQTPDSGVGPGPNLSPAPAADPVLTPTPVPSVPRKMEAQPGPAARGLSTRGQKADTRPKYVAGENAPAADAVDPTLRLDLIAKLKTVTVSRTDRSLFDFTTEAPKPVQPEPKIALRKPQPKMVGPELPPPPPPRVVKPPPPPPPPLPFKYYGLLAPKPGGKKRAFLLDGEEIFVPEEGETVRRRYKIIRVGVNSVTIEDLDFKHQSSLPLMEDPNG